MRRCEFMLNVADVDKSSPPGVLAYSDMMGLWLDGKLAIAPMWPHMYTTSKDPTSSKVVGKVKLDIPPGNPDRVATAYSWGFCAASGSKNPDAAVEWVKWSTAASLLADFGKTWLNPVPRASSIERVKADTIDQRRGQGGDRDLRALGGWIEDHEHGAAIFAAAWR